MNGMLIALIAILILVLIGVAVAAVLIGLRNRKRGAAADTRPEPTDPFGTGDQDSLRGDPRALKAGDIVEVRGQSYTVRGSLRLSEGGWSWSEHLLDDAKGTQVWLGVEEDPDLILSLWMPLEDTESTEDTENTEDAADDQTASKPEPGASSIEFDGRTYTREESGTADFRSEATTGLDEHGRIRYQDYKTSDGALLGFESYGDAGWEISRGEQLSRYDVRIYPTSN